MDKLFSELMVPLLAAIVPLVIGGIKSIKFVQEGERGIRLRFGRAVRHRDGTPKIYEPGFVLLIPFVDKLQRRHVRQQVVNFEHQRIVLENGLVFIVSAILLFRVTDIYKALFETDELDPTIEGMGMGVLRDVISECKEHTEMLDTASIGKKLLSNIKDRGEQWGVEFIEFRLTNCSPTQETATIINVHLAAESRAKALNQAATNTGVPVTSLNSALGAALIGVPLVVSITDRNVNVHLKGDDEEKKNFSDLLLEQYTGDPTS